MDVRRRTRALTVGLLLTMSLHAAHGLAVVTALPVVARALDGRSLYGAALAAYLLASLVGLAWAGARVDRRGLASTFALGMGVFAVGVGTCAVAPNMSALVFGRSVEGLGGGMLATVLYAAVNRAYPDAERPRMLAWLSAAWIFPGLAAPPLAGWVAEHVGWRWVFVGLGPGIVVASLLALPPLRGLTAPPASSPARSRVGAALRLAIGTALTTVAFGASGDATLRGLGVVIGIVLGAPALRALLPPGSFALRGALPSAIAAKAMLAFAFFAADSFLPLVFVEIHGTSAAFAGWVLTLGSLAWSAGAWVQGQHADRLSPGAWIAWGALLLFLGLAACAVTLRPGASLGFAFAGWAVAGVAMGLAYNASAVLAMRVTPRGEEGQTSSWLGLADAIGVGAATSLGGVGLAMGSRAGADLGASLAGLWALALAVTAVLGVAGVRLIETRTPATTTPPVDRP